MLTRLPILLLMVCLACNRADLARSTPSAADSAISDSIARARQDSINRLQPGYVVDSILPVEEELRRFKAGIGGKPATELAGGAASREALISRFMKSVTLGDSVALRAMLLNASEFADLVYPVSPYVRPPYKQSPGLVWSQIQNASESGLVRLLRRMSHARFRYLSHTCEATPERQGKNRIWSHCSLRIKTAGGNTQNRHLFGAIIERHGHFKIVSYTNDF